MNMMSRATARQFIVAACLGSLLGVSGLTAQDPNIGQEIQQSQRRLEQIREERAQLERDVGSMRNQVRDVSQELANVERRLSSTTAILAEVEFLSGSTSEQIQNTTRDLIFSQDRLAESEAVLNRRLREIYKMGALHTVQVLLGARSFTDLLNRYRYLQQIGSSDRQLVERVSLLETELVDHNDELKDRMALLGTLRQDRISEVAELRSVENERERALTEFRSREVRATSRIDELEADESRMATLIADLEERRRALEARRARSGGVAISNADAESLDWPLQGNLIYRFGLERRPNGTNFRWNGIGLAAVPGTPVRAVRAGQVLFAGRFEGYGLIVILYHGGGFYTHYMYLEEIGVVEGREVEAGQVVGGGDTPEGPHLEFQIRQAVGEDLPRAQDPLQWLKPLPVR